ncbi:MAG: T9SS type A sorting domain-containing protein [Saprospiraceae bacterium]|nr:T9SS type A sorting domain-containing protein [Saprospiraceae bacterium]
MPLRYLLSFFILLMPIVGLSQNGEIRSIEKSHDYYYKYCLVQEEYIFLLSDALDCISVSGQVQKLNLDLELSNGLSMCPLNAFSKDYNSLIITWYSLTTDSIVLISTEYDPTLHTSKALDTLVLDISADEVFFTKQNLVNNEYIVYLSIFDRSISRADYIVPISVAQKTGRLSARKHVRGGSNNDLFALGWVKSITVLSNDSLLLTGRTHIAAITDKSLDVLQLIGVRYQNKHTGYEESILGPVFLKRGGNKMVGSAVSVYDTPNLLDEFYFTCRLQDGSLIIDTVIIASNKEKLGKRDIKSIILNDNSELTVTNPDYQAISRKAEIKSNIYLTKYYRGQELWHKSFGGDYFYIAEDIELIDSSGVIIVGSVYDINNNNFLQGFYFMIDQDGNLLSTNMDIHPILKVSVFPNPTSHHIIVKMNHRGHTDYWLSSIEGQLVTEGELHDNRIDVSEVDEGVYILSIMIEGSVHSKKVVISR